MKKRKEFQMRPDDEAECHTDLWSPTAWAAGGRFLSLLFSVVVKTWLLCTYLGKDIFKLRDKQTDI